MFIKILLLILLLPYLISTEPILLTDKTWGDMLHGQWMVEFYAPWCGACKQFTPIWNDFSKVMTSTDVKVGAIDVEKYPSLSGRFRISALPTIYYIYDGVFRQYDGERSVRRLRKYVEQKEWEKTEPISTYFGPNSILMSLASRLFDVSVLVKNTHAILQDYYGWPSWVIYALFAVGVVCFGVVLGFGFLQIVDYCLGGLSKNDTDTVPEDIDELDDGDSQKLKEQTPDQSEEDEVNESDNLIEEEQQITTDQTIRQRRVKD